MHFRVATQNELWKEQGKGKVYKCKNHRMQFFHANAVLLARFTRVDYFQHANEGGKNYKRGSP